MANNKTSRTPVCVYWDPDVGVYRIYLADWSPSMRGHVATTYLGSADPDMLAKVMARFGYVRVGCVA